MTLESAQLAVLADAARRAERLRRGAEQDRAQLLAGARAEAEALLARRLAIAERLAERERRERLAEARADARRVVLRARRTVLSDTSQAAHAAARELARQPVYAKLMAVLSAEAKERLSTPTEHAHVARAPGGGIVARAGSREIDYSLDSQVNRCMQSLSAELERLWR